MYLFIEKREEDEDEVVEVYEEVPQPHVIETGDSVKVKQVLDDSTMAAVVDAGFEANYNWENFKLFLMFLSCVFAMLAQFYPMPFPDSRLLLAVCCGLYFIISTVLQYIVVFVDKDTIMFTKANTVSWNTSFGKSLVSLNKCDCDDRSSQTRCG